ncbi:hypothetical protein A3F86_01730, partial [candidate division WOR-1 bacterium RIFCSPLOWO2_12_FULL_45_9]
FFSIQSASFGKPTAAQEYFNKAAIQYISGDLKGALKNLSATLKIDPKHKEALELKNSILRETNVVSIKTRVKETEEIDKYLAEGKGAFQEAALEKALAAFTKILELDSENNEALSYVTMIQSKIKEQEARSWWQPYIGVFGVTLLGGIASVVFLVFLIIFIKGAIDKIFGRSTRKLVCFKCKAKLPANEEFCPHCGARVGLKMWQAVSEEQKIWYDKMGWHNNPFTLDCHPELFTGYKKEVKQILEKISSRSGHILVVGPLGSGKTTLLRWLGAYLPQALHPVYLSRPPQEFSQLLKFIISSMGHKTDDKTEYNIYYLDSLRKKMGKNLVLLLDEAHEFTAEMEHPLRTLGDMDNVILVMAGLPETVYKLKNEIKPLYERLVLNISLDNLDFDDLKTLLIARVEDAGGKGTHPFTASALEKIFEVSMGNPRLSLELCDMAVTQAINQGEDNINASLIKKGEGLQSK